MTPPKHVPTRFSYRFLGKRAVDVLVAAAAMVVLSPLMVVVAVLVRWRLGSPVLFRQTRPGLHARPFTILKFRTMRDLRGPDGSPLPDRHRLTEFGAFLRRTSLDELPELWNVLRGDMSLVGPRPLLPEYLPHYDSSQARRHEVRPGLTGLAQVNGRNATTWERRLELDVEYVDRISPWLDLSILTRTLVGVARQHGITAAGHATMPRFGGRSKAMEKEED